jgi:hypothetical protein
MIRPLTATDLRRAVAAKIACGLLVAAGRASSADPPPESPPQTPSTEGALASSISERLFVEGRALMKEGRYEKACETFKTSYDLDPTATGTLLNLALCHEQIGKRATAWAEFRRVVAESTGKRDERARFAKEHEEKLLPTLSHFRLVVPPATRVSGLTIRIDGGSPISEASWETEIPVDAGSRRIEVSAPRKTTRTQTMNVVDGAPPTTFRVDPLDDAPDPGGRQRLLGYGLAGTGVAAIAVGVAFAVAAANRKEDADAICPDRTHCPSQEAKNDASAAFGSASRSANLANVLVGAGALLVAIGLPVAILARSDPSRGRSATLRLSPTSHAGGLIALSGAF